MQNIIKILVIILLFAPALSGCKKFLDIVPDERPTEVDAFRDPISAKGYLYSCYGWIPDSRSGTESIDLYTADEVTTAFEHETFAKFPRGEYTASAPVISYWDNLYKGIRQCYIFIDNIDKVPNLPASDAADYKAEANFLIGWYHFLLVRMYGPVIIAEKQFNINMPTSEYPIRNTYDEAVAFVVKKMDEAILSLPTSRAAAVDFGRATNVIARAVKARMLLYAASPLFNGGGQGGNSLFSNFKDKSGKNLLIV